MEREGYCLDMWIPQRAQSSAMQVLLEVPLLTAQRLTQSDAGSGTILDGLRFEIPLIVVPNTDLLHNHQVELAEELAKQNYVVHGKLG